MSVEGLQRFIFNEVFIVTTLSSWIASPLCLRRPFSCWSDSPLVTVRGR